MANAALTEFVRQALARGTGRTEIETLLRQAGWPAAAVREAVGAFAESDYPLPVPRPRPYISARDAFMHLLLFASLGLSAYYLGSLLFHLVDLKLPDTSQVQTWYRPEKGVRFAIAFLVVSFPLFLFVNWRLAAEAGAEPTKRASRVRKWLTYIALFVAAMFVVGAAVALINEYLSGDLSLRVGLKCLTVAVIAGGIFG